MAATRMKLFGKTILFPEINKTHFDLAYSDDHGIGKEKSLCFEDSVCSFSVSDEDTKNLEDSELTNESGSSNPIEEGSKNSTPSSKNPKTPTFETVSDLHNNSKSEHSESNSENTPKKPDKSLPCPRCDSADTKFCYYNNYNLTQPRYFCKNCQRYWTSGGTMRNVPVGSGRRKNKNSFDSHFFQIMVPGPYQAPQAYGEVINFGSYPHTKPRESFVSKPNFDEKSQNCFRKFSSRENEDDRSSITSTVSLENVGKNKFSIQAPVIQNFENFSSIMFYQSPGFFSFPCFYSQNRDSRILGKRSRKTETFSGPEENNLWFPKASRFDDPNDGAKQSVWSSLGIKNEKSDEIKGKVVFEAFKSNKNYERYVGDNSLVLQANPAALARSANFHEIV